MKRRRLVGLYLFGALGCAAEAEEHLIDEGKACIDRQPGDGYRAVVDSGLCLRTCDNVIDATCTATVGMRVLTVTSNITVKRIGERECREVCRSPRFACPVPPLEDGIYTLAYGDAIAAVTIPFEMGMGACTDAE